MLHTQALPLCKVKETSGKLIFFSFLLAVACMIRNRFKVSHCHINGLQTKWDPREAKVNAQEKRNNKRTKHTHFTLRIKKTERNRSGKNSLAIFPRIWCVRVSVCFHSFNYNVCRKYNVHCVRTCGLCTFNCANVLCGEWILIILNC